MGWQPNWPGENRLRVRWHLYPVGNDIYFLIECHADWLSNKTCPKDICSPAFKFSAKKNRSRSCQTLHGKWKTRKTVIQATRRQNLHGKWKTRKTVIHATRRQNLHGKWKTRKTVTRTARRQTVPKFYERSEPQAILTQRCTRDQDLHIVIKFYCINTLFAQLMDGWFWCWLPSSTHLKRERKKHHFITLWRFESLHSPRPGSYLALERRHTDATKTSHGHKNNKDVTRTQKQQRRHTDTTQRRHTDTTTTKTSHGHNKDVTRTQQ